MLFDTLLVGAADLDMVVRINLKVGTCLRYISNFLIPTTTKKIVGSGEFRQANNVTYYHACSKTAKTKMSTIVLLATVAI